MSEQQPPAVAPEGEKKEFTIKVDPTLLPSRRIIATLPVIARDLVTASARAQSLILSEVEIKSTVDRMMNDPQLALQGIMRYLDHQYIEAQAQKFMESNT